MQPYSQSTPYEQAESNIISISRYISLLNQNLKKCSAKIVGEVSDIKISANGHVYFDLKDPQDNSCLHCIIWKTDYKLFGIDLQNGMKIIATGFPEVYSSYGKLSLNYSFRTV